ncbi:MAG: restriction endonuclease subunit S [Gammaproteobacteria bacterium]|nr:MAG: restriction endonuclease subunit S [Gammaproteobacteria bacterium]
MSDLKKIGIVDDSFRLATVEELIEEGTLDRPMDGNHGEQHPKVADYASEGIPFIMANDLSGGRVDYDSCNFITKKQADGLRKGFAKPGDVLVTHKATIGRTALVGDEADPYIVLTPQVTYYRIKNQEVLDNRYLRHYFDNQFFQKTLAIWAGAGATRAYLGITGQRKLPIIVPPRPKQRKIAAILTAYGDLIETNKRRIALLEKMAEELYREWFVRMRFPGHEDTKFVKGVPEGWDETQLGKIARFTMGQSPKSEFYNETGDGLPFHQGVGTYGDRFPNTVTYCSVDGRRASKRDILFSVRAPVGRLNIADCDMIIGRGLAAIRHADDKNSYLYYLLRTVFASEDIIGNGAIFNSVGKDELSRFALHGHSEELIQGFEDIAKPMDGQIENLIRATANLTQTRDILLPRLISGKLSVEDLDIQFPPSMQEEATEPEPAHA